MTITVEALRAHLNMQGDPDGIDAIVLPKLLAAATGHVERVLGYKLDDAVELPDGAPADLEQAVLMLAADWYENREATLVGVTAQEVPFGVALILGEHRRYTFGLPCNG